MFLSRKPSLRHFAVLERAHRNLLGSTWAVQDRRNPLRKQFLFVPSRLRSWPISLSRLELMEPTPTRLRNGRVAVLLSTSDLSRIRLALSKPSVTSVPRLNALTGFESSERKSKLRLALLPALLICFSLLVLIPKEQSLATPTSKQTMVQKQELGCRININEGEKALGTLRRFSFLDIAGQRYKIAHLQKLGGLAQVKLKRVCDKTYVRVDLWSDGYELKVEKVY